jgi:hypothetical protein
MDYPRAIALALQVIAFALIFSAFIPVRQRTENGGRTLHVRPWLLAYGVAVFILWSLLDVIVSMKFLG